MDGNDQRLRFPARKQSLTHRDAQQQKIAPMDLSVLLPQNVQSDWGRKADRSPLVGTPIWERSPSNRDMKAAAVAPSVAEEPTPARSERARVVSGELLPATRWSPTEHNIGKSPRQEKANEAYAQFESAKASLQHCLDSPTIPGLRPRPVFERSITSPNRLDRPQSSGSNDKTPLASAFPGMVDVGLYASDQTPRENLRRVSSMMLLKELKPLSIPSKNSSQVQKISSRQATPIEPEDHLPPEVPPKSPRTESRASPRVQLIAHSASSSVSTLHSNASTSQLTVSSMSSTQTDCRPETYKSPSQTPLTKSPGTPFSKFNRYQSIQTHSPQPRNNSGDEDTKSMWSRLIPGSSAERARTRSRGESDISPYNAGKKPTGKVTGMRKMRDLVLGSGSGDTHFPTLPRGYRPTEATSKLCEADSSALRRQAWKEAENFEILEGKDVCSLSLEAQELEERCNHLRATHRELREGRNNLQNWMIAYLKSPRNHRISRELVVRQEEKLAVLDSSVDEYASKVDVTEARRAQVQQKLLQHFAASLTLQSTGRSPPVDENTPPISPDQDQDYFNNQRKDVQSIKIYAGEGVANESVAALVAEINRGIEFAGEPVTPLM